MLHRTICFVALHNVAVQYVALQHAVAVQHRIVVQCIYRSAALLQRNSQGEGGGALAGSPSKRRVHQQNFFINVFCAIIPKCKPPSTPQTKRWL